TTAPNAERRAAADRTATRRLADHASDLPFGCAERAAADRARGRRAAGATDLRDAGARERREQERPAHVAERSDEARRATFRPRAHDLHLGPTPRRRHDGRQAEGS